MSLTRLNAVSYLNTKPLVYALEEHLLVLNFRLIYDVPSICAQQIKKGNADVKEALAYNPNLDNMLIKELLKEKYLAAVLAKNVKLNDALFELLMPYKEYLAQNETLTKEMQTQLLKQEDKNIYLLFLVFCLPLFSYFL